VKHYQAKYSALYHAQNGRCALTGKMLMTREKADLGHALIPNTKVNRKLYPHFIDSLLNLELVCHDAHMTQSHNRIPYYVAQRIEEKLAADKDLSDRLNLDTAIWSGLLADVKQRILVDCWPEREGACAK
jgi:hypothetical protein